MSIERIVGDEPGSDGHRLRYHLAAGLLVVGDTVLDAACGSGYGAHILKARGGVDYVGMDKNLDDVLVGQLGDYIVADLNYQEPDFDFDVFVGFETIEHLVDYDTYVRMARRARRLIVVSAPIVPTVEDNEFHLHDFELGDLAKLFAGGEWEVFGEFIQPAEVSEIVVLVRT